MLVEAGDEQGLLGLRSGSADAPAVATRFELLRTRASSLARLLLLRTPRNASLPPRRAFGPNALRVPPLHAKEQCGTPRIRRARE